MEGKDNLSFDDSKTLDWQNPKLVMLSESYYGGADAMRADGSLQCFPGSQGIPPQSNCTGFGLGALASCDSGGDF